METYDTAMMANGIAPGNGIFDGARLSAEAEESTAPRVTASGVELPGGQGMRTSLREVHLSWYDITLLASRVQLAPVEDTRLEHIRTAGVWVPRWTTHWTEVAADQEEAAEWLRIGLRERWVTDLQVFRYRLAGRLVAACRPVYFAAGRVVAIARDLLTRRRERDALRADLLKELKERRRLEAELAEAQRAVLVEVTVPEPDDEQSN